MPAEKLDFARKMLKVYRLARHVTSRDKSCFLYHQWFKVALSPTLLGTGVLNLFSIQFLVGSKRLLLILVFMLGTSVNRWNVMFGKCKK